MAWLKRIGFPLLLFAGGVGIGVIISNAASAETGDWLSFAGAVTGAAVTVLGALLVNSFQANTSARDRRRLLTDQFQKLRASINSIKNFDEHDDDPRDALAHLAKRLSANITLLKRSCEWVNPDSAAMAKALFTIQDLQGELRLTKGDPRKPTYLFPGEYELDQQLMTLEGRLLEAEALLQEGARIVTEPYEGQGGH